MHTFKTAQNVKKRKVGNAVSWLEMRYISLSLNYWTSAEHKYIFLETFI